jgi:hypothetical protein
MRIRGDIDRHMRINRLLFAVVMAVAVALVGTGLIHKIHF